MRTLHASSNNYTGDNKKLFIVIILYCLLNFPFGNGSCMKNLWANDLAYTENTIEYIRTNLKTCQNKVVWLEDIKLQSTPLIYRFYSINEFQPRWTAGNELNQQAVELLALLKDAYKYGFEPANFDIITLEQFAQELNKEENIEKSAMMRARFEFLMTNSVFTFMLQIQQGEELTYKDAAYVRVNSPISGFPEFLKSIISLNQLHNELLKLQPKDSTYRILQSEMEWIVMNLDIENSVVIIPELYEDPLRCSKLFTYLFNLECISVENIDISKPEVFTKYLIEYQNSIGIRKSGKIDMATRNAITDIIMGRYDEIAIKLEQIRRNNVFEENAFAFN